MKIWTDTRGDGPDVLLIAGLSDPAEAWEEQLRGLSPRWRVTAYDNRGAGRTPLGDDELTVPLLTEDAAAVIDSIGADGVHVCGFSGGSLVAQELALRHPGKVRSLVLVSTWCRTDAWFRSVTTAWRRLAEHAPDERAMWEDFLLWIYTARGHENGFVKEVIDEALAYPHPQTTEAFLAQLDAFVNHDSHDRIDGIAVPTLVLSGAEDITTPSRLGRVVAERIPGARFEVLPGEAHQPFQESPRDFNARVDAFWQSIEAPAGGGPTDESRRLARSIPG